MDNGGRVKIEQKNRLPFGSPSLPWGDCSVFKDSLHHSVVCVGDLGCCHSLCLLGSAGCYINYFAVAVEGDNLDLILFVAAVCVCGDDADVCHDFEVFDG